jgi:putative oxidoreductase
MSGEQKKWVRVVGHVVAALLGLAFVMAGGFKLTGPAEMLENFARWGYPSWFLSVTGVIELVAGLLLFLPRTRAYGALLLVPTMLGAFLTHAVAGEWSQTPPALVMGALSALLLWWGRGELLRWFSSRGR